MRIFIVCNNLGKGGAERVGVNLANGFASLRHDVYIVTDVYQKVNYPVDKKVKILPFCKNKKGKVKKWFNATRNIRKYTKQENPDVIIGIMEACTLISFIATLGTSTAVVMTEHNSFERPITAPLSLRNKLFKFWINKLYNNITVLTEADKQHIGSHLKNVMVMPNPLFLTPTQEIPPKEKMVLAAGRVDAWHVKGFDILLQTWKSLYYDIFNDNKNLRDWWLKIAGDGKKEVFEYLMNLLTDGEWVYNVNENDDINDDDNHLNTKHPKEKKTGAEKQNSQKSGVWRSEKYHIEFLGFQKDMESLYKKSEIFVLSSRYEGFGLVLIEAMSQGCACVACDYKGRQREIIQDDNQGLCCEPDNVNSLATALEKMMTDEAYRKQVQRNAIERSKFYDMEHTMNRWEIYLKKVIYAS